MKLLHGNKIGEGSTNVIILHGFLGMGDNWKSHAKNWAAIGYTVHLVDQRNHGKSFWSDDFNYSLLSEDLKHYMDHYQIEKAIILGHSMGGKTAMNFACLYPERIEKLIIADIAPRVYPSHHHTILEALSSMDFKYIKNRNEAALHLSTFISEEGVRQFLLKNLYWEAPGKLALRMNIAVLSQMGATIGAALESNKTFSGEVLFLKGASSDYIQAKDHQLIHQHFPKAKILTIPNAGHWLHAENPKAFSAEFLQWNRE